MFWMGPNECVWSVRCFVKSEGRLAVLNPSLCSRNLLAKLRPVCPTYVLPQSGHVSLYTPNREYKSVFYFLRVKRFCMELLVRNEIFKSAFLNRFVIKVVSLPMYVKVAHFCVVGRVCVFCCLFSVCVRGSVCVVWWGVFVVVGREGIVSQDVLYGSDFCVVVFFL